MSSPRTSLRVHRGFELSTTVRVTIDPAFSDNADFAVVQCTLSDTWLSAAFPQDTDQIRQEYGSGSLY
jgi:hypothetical protein